MGVWGIWWDDTFIFSTGTQSRKARNLTARPFCTVVTESAAEAVIVEGKAVLTSACGETEAIATAYRSKYGSGYPADSSLFRVVPETVFAFIVSSSETEFAETATRWKAHT
jgi:hypothetical protein